MTTRYLCDELGSNEKSSRGFDRAIGGLKSNGSLIRGNDGSGGKLAPLRRRATEHTAEPGRTGRSGAAANKASQANALLGTQCNALLALKDGSDGLDARLGGGDGDLALDALDQSAVNISGPGDRRPSPSIPAAMKKVCDQE